MTETRRSRIESVLRNRQPDLTVLLENVHDPHNVSAVFRTADAVGIQEVHVLNTVIARHESFGINSAASAAKWLTIHQHESAAACFAGLRASGYVQILATHLEADASDLYDLDLTLPTALVFGNERKGVTAQALSFCDGNFVVPQMGMVRSLNISVACAVSIYEALRQRKEAGLYRDAGRLNAATAADLRERWGLNEEE